MIGYRHLVTSLIAIFIALGLGIFIGHFISAKDQASSIEQLPSQYELNSEENGYAAVVATNVELLESIAMYEEFGKVLLDSLLNERLAGKNLALIVTGHQEVPTSMLEVLDLAGAKIVSQTIVGDLSIPAEALSKSLIDFYGLPVQATGEEIRRQIGISTGVIVSGQNSSSTVEYLTQWNLVHFAGDYQVPVDGFIILGGAIQDEVNASTSFDIGLILGLGQHPGVKVGVECSEVAVTYMSEYQQLRLRTIDNVDQMPGQYALVMALDQVQGNFGIKPTADQLIPSWIMP